MDDESRIFEVFLDVQRGLPRQGPGSEGSTLKALSLCGGMPERPRVLDIGCGPGMQTLVLAQALDGRIAAADTSREYLDELQARAEAAGVFDRIEILNEDMSELPFRPQSFDLIWSEGAAYIMGFEEALTAWKQLLKPGGCIAVSELVWLRSDPPCEVAEFFGSEYPAMTDVETNLETVRRCGYEPLGHFTFPDADWWDDYYRPLKMKLPGLYKKYAGDEKALQVIESTAREIDMRRRFGAYYGYEFFIGSTENDNSLLR
jgi:ubiquinone/menaquinone biosynthesis C-methylase UbiE